MRDHSEEGLPGSHCVIVCLEPVVGRAADLRGPRVTVKCGLGPCGSLNRIFKGGAAFGNMVRAPMVLRPPNPAPKPTVFGSLST
jgi:hypothetical protein